MMYDRVRFHSFSCGYSFPAPFIEKIVLYHGILLALCNHILVYLKYLGLFLGSWFYFIHQCVCSYVNTILFWLLHLFNIVSNQELQYLQLYIFSRCFGYLRPFVVPYKIGILLLLFLLKCYWDCTESVDSFGLYGHFNSTNSLYMNIEYVFHYLCQISFIIIYSFWYTDLSLPWLNLFLRILLFLMLLQKELFSLPFPDNW